MKKSNSTDLSNAFKPLLANRLFKFRFFRVFDEHLTGCSEPKMLYGSDFAFSEYAPLNDQFSREINIMQFTGLKDKNGIDIYEGDILHNGFNAQGIMRFKEGMFVCNFVYNNKLPKYNQQEMTFRINCINLVCNVIGNIFENPELLAESN